MSGPRLFHYYLPLVAVTLLACYWPPTRILPPGNIFVKGRTLTYQVTQPASAQGTPPVDTLVLTSFGLARSKTVYTFPTEHFTLVAEQINVGFGYGAHATPNSFSGVFEHDSLLWSHPPRDGAYAVLELSPYPYVQLPPRIDHQWSWDLGVGDSWSSPQWATWRGLIHVKSRYRMTGQQWLSTPLGALHCWVVRAEASSPVGNSSLVIWYHPTYGFVRLEYLTIQGRSMTFQLVTSTVETPAEPLRLPYLLYPLPAPTVPTGKN